MAIYKAKCESNFTVMPNSTLRDKSISFEARGVLSLMLSMPDDWQMYKSWLVDQCEGTGKDKMTRILKELEVSGYLRREHKRSNGKFSDVDWFVYSTPECGLPATEDGLTDNGLAGSGKPAPTKKPFIQNKDNTNINVPSSIPPKFENQDMVFSIKAYETIKQRLPNFNKPNLESWSKTVRLMRERDGRTLADCERVFVWAQRDSFWQSNVLSMDKLRKQFDRLNDMSNKGSNANGLSKKGQATAKALSEMFDGIEE